MWFVWTAHNISIFSICSCDILLFKMKRSLFTVRYELNLLLNLQSTFVLTTNCFKISQKLSTICNITLYLAFRRQSSWSVLGLVQAKCNANWQRENTNQNIILKNADISNNGGVAQRDKVKMWYMDCFVGWGGVEVHVGLFIYSPTRVYRFETDWIFCVFINQYRYNRLA